MRFIRKKIENKGQLMLLVGVTVLLFDIILAVEYSITPTANEILAISTTKSEIAIAYSEIIRLYVIIGDIVEIGNVSLPEHITTDPGFLEFKLISSREIAYCGSNSCGYCSFFDANPFCKKLSLFYKMQTSQGLKSASITANNGKIVLRLVDETNRAAILLYNIQSKGYAELPVIQYAMDIDRISNQLTVASFSRGNYVYFVGSELQSYDPLINSPLWIYSNHWNYTVVKMTRICTSDVTPMLASRIDLHLGCGDRSTAGPTHYDPVKQHMWQVVQLENGNQTICHYDMQTMEKTFDNTWNTCQAKYSGEIDDCTNMSDIKYLKDHCFILNRLSNGHLDSCVSSNQKGFPPVDNCKVDTISTAYHQFGWLEQFKMYEGHSLVKYGPWMDGFTSIFPVNFDDNAVLVRNKGNEKNIYWVSLGNSSILADILIDKFTLPAAKKSIAISQDHLFFINKNSVYSVPVTCEGLYKTCAATLTEGSKSPGRCAWCADEKFNRALSLHEKTTCKRTLTKKCPPTIHFIRRKDDVTFELFGTHFNNIVYGKIQVCEEQCYTKAELSDDERLVCFLNKSIAKDVLCEVRLTLKLQNYENFLVIAKMSIHSNAILPTHSTEATSTMHSGITVISLVCLLIISLEAIYIVFYCCTPTQPSSTDLDKDSEEMVDSPLLPISNNAAENTTDENISMQVLEHAHQNEASATKSYSRSYEGLFKEMSDDVKINRESLFMGEKIGEGYFGVVYLTTYRPGEKESMSVACKTIKKSGAEDFFREGRTMKKFNHPKVVKFIGMALDEHSRPIIVTEFMANGNLQKHLQINGNTTTTAGLLHFAVQIAEGMEYLHKQNFIHRDLAARNCMLSNTLQLKIADFGLARQCNDDKIYAQNILPHLRPPLPVAWLAIEILIDNSAQFTLKADVWSYGVVLWEIFSQGSHPYGELQGRKAFSDFLLAGNRLEKPHGCPEQMYTDIMQPCWSIELSERKEFSELVPLVTEIWQKAVNPS